MFLNTDMKDMWIMSKKQLENDWGAWSLCSTWDCLPYNYVYRRNMREYNLYASRQIYYWILQTNFYQKQNRLRGEKKFQWFQAWIYQNWDIIWTYVPDQNKTLQSFFSQFHIFKLHTFYGIWKIICTHRNCSMFNNANLLESFV